MYKPDMYKLDIHSYIQTVNTYISMHILYLYVIFYTVFVYKFTYINAYVHVHIHMYKYVHVHAIFGVC